MRVQAVMQTHRAWSTRRNLDPKETLPLLRAGFALCGICGQRMATAPHRNGGRHYCCRNGRTLMYSQPEQACPGKAFSIRASTVDDEVWAEVAKVARDTDRVQR